MKCPKCQTENPETNKFCRECGTRLPKVCPHCGSEVLPEDKFCGQCGRPLGETPPVTATAGTFDKAEPKSYTPQYLADKILNTRRSLEGERKLVTVLFADVAGYTSLSEKLDPEEVHKIMEGCLEILMDEIHKYEGTINQFTGDGVMALFGAPLAHEDHAQRACYAALAIQKDLAEYGRKIKEDLGQEFLMRIGLNSGPVVVGAIGDDLHMDYTAIGDTINLAARVQQAASPGEVWLSQATRGLIRGYFSDEPVGEVILKGKAEPQKLYRVIADRPEVRTRFEAGLARGMTELVGRRPEMEALRATFERVKGGQDQVIDLVGEAGVGKSRLVYEFHKSLDQEAVFLCGVCLQYGRSMNFLPVREVVQEAFGLREGMDEETVKGRIKEQAAENLTPFLPFYHNLLSLEVADPKFKSLNPEGRKFGTFEAVKSLLLTLSQQKPLVVFLEDVHWMDKISEEFFTYLSRCIHGYPVMMLSAYRPEASPPWTREAHYQKLGLETLGLNSSIRLVMNLLGGLKLDPALEGKIAEKAGGNPFFMEEIVRELLERGDLVRENDRFICRCPNEQIEIPSTIQGVIAARMDRLSEDLKRTTQVASVIGRDFTYRILKSVMELGEELRGHLTNLVGLELLYEKTLYPELEYIFKNSLTQDVAYESLLKQRRQEIHGRIARAIEELYTDKLEPHYEILAHHWELGGNPQKAIGYLILAGEKSNRENAVQSARVFLRGALDLSQRHQVTLDSLIEARVRQGLGTASRAIGDFDTAAKELKKAVEIRRQLGLVEQEMESLVQEAGTIIFSEADQEQGLRFFDEAMTRTKALGRKEEESLILMLKGTYICIAGHRYAGCLMIREAEKLALQSGDPGTISTVRFSLSHAERWLGYPEKAVKLTEGGVEAMLSLFNFDVASLGIYARGLALAETGRIEEAMKILNDGIRTCESHGVMVHLGRLYNCLGYCYMEILQIEKARELNFRSQELGRALIKGYPAGRGIAGEIVAHAMVNLMENHLDLGNAEAAWEFMKSFEREATGDDFSRSRDRWGARLEALAAAILLERDDPNQAEIIVLRNLDTAQREQVKKYEGRFLRLLGEVQTRRGEFDQALASLSEAVRILGEVGNPRLLWQAHGSLASAYERRGRSSEAREQWGKAAEIIRKVDSGLADRQLGQGFLKARPVREILAKQ
ncbi:MAG: AAA family ATPase [Deltaproteobacteria bacterium]|nr:AAA family ATPase [Deltaproteobacteria bacterium]